MKYVHTAVYKVKGFTLAAEQDGKELIVDANRNLRAVITSQPDELCLNGDRADIVANLMLNAVFRPARAGSFDEALASELEKLRERRKAELEGAAALVIEVTGQVEDLTTPHYREHEEFVVSLDSPSKDSLREASEDSTAAALAAMALASENVLALRKLADSVILFREDGKPVYAYTFSESTMAYVSRAMTDEAIASLATWYPKLVENDSLRRIIRLLTSSFQTDGDTLRSFLAAWTALEIFVNKTFAHYEERLFAELNEGEHPAVRMQHLGRVRDVMKDKYRLADKFAVICCQLCPAGADRDAAEFKRAKGIRDKLAHGEDIADSSLPVAAVQSLVRKYMRLHVG